jgi:hypothetical protein
LLLGGKLFLSGDFHSFLLVFIIQKFLHEKDFKNLSLGVKGAPKAAVLKAQFLGWCLLEVVEPLRGKAWWEVFRSLGAGPQGDSGTLAPPLFLFAPWT